MKLEELKGKTVGVCVSGGLDSKTICCVLKDAGVKVKAFSANVGQPDEKDINEVIAESNSCEYDLRRVKKSIHRVKRIKKMKK